MSTTVSAPGENELPEMVASPSLEAGGEGGELDNETILAANEDALQEALTALEPEGGAAGEELDPSSIEGAQAGRARAASAMTRIFGHFMAEKKPRATWIVSVLKLDKDPGGNVLRDTIWKRILQVPRFRSVMKVNRFGGYWSELSEEEMLRLRDEAKYLWSELGESGDFTKQNVMDVVNGCMEWEYDRHLPLWRCQYVRKMQDGSASLIMTINHGVGDGMSLVATLLGLADSPPDLSKTPYEMAQLAKEARKLQPAPAKPAVRGPKLGSVAKLRSFSYGVFEGSTNTLWKPDPKNSLSMPDVTKPSSVKRLAEAEPISLDEMKKVKSKFPGATLNDVMMAVMTATVRAYMLEVGDPAATNGSLVRGSFPINLRSPHETVLRRGDPMNKWSYGTFHFDFKYKSRVELVWKVKRQVDKIKVSPSPLLTYRMVNVLSKALPRRVLLDTVLGVANQGTAQLSNVPGPSEPIFLAGAKVEDLAFNLFTPVGLYFGLVSYNGKVTASMNVDGSSACDPKLLAKHWNLEFEALKQEVEAFGDQPIHVPRYWF